MARTHNLGFPRMGAKRELKFALEAYWRGDLSGRDLEERAAALRREHWRRQERLDLVPVGDFSLYDGVLDMSFTLGAVPQRALALGGSELDVYFRLARGRAPGDPADSVTAAGEMTKWFDTNYHYIVPEFSAETTFRLDVGRLLGQMSEARGLGLTPKPVIVGPVTYLWLGKAKDGSDRLALLERLLPVYEELLETLAAAGAEWVQIDEPALATELAPEWLRALERVYDRLQDVPTKLLLATYFGPLAENLELACRLPVHGLHLDAVRAPEEAALAAETLPEPKVLSIGMIDGRNIWKTDFLGALDRLEPLAGKLGERLWLAPSCSLLHVPVDLDGETKLDPELKSWLSFARQKLEEVRTLAQALNEGRDAVAPELAANAAAMRSRRESPRTRNPVVREASAGVTSAMGERRSPYAERATVQRARLNLPLYPTTTIGSFPQTDDIRRARRQFKKGELSEEAYRTQMRREIDRCVVEQEMIGLDVLVHGEAERNDMVEYFGEQLEGYAFTENGWVQSYGSRCVKPPVIFGDVRRPAPMTVEWTRYAQSRTSRPMKGMLTGPVTMLNWSFVRDDQPRSQTCLQLALAIRGEVQDLERAGIAVIQIDEPALREGLPLRKAQWKTYLDWAGLSFRVAANGVGDAVQIHTHMCYCEFNDIIDSIAALDADVITIETSRSDMELLDAFDAFQYPNEIGPGVYDIHSPNIPRVERMVALMRKAAEKIPPELLWVNPDCGLKTRRWNEVIPALSNMVQAARILRE